MKLKIIAVEEDKVVVSFNGVKQEKPVFLNRLAQSLVNAIFIENKTIYKIEYFHRGKIGLVTSKGQRVQITLSQLVTADREFEITPEAKINLNL